jgi:hypothetical protein
MISHRLTFIDTNGKRGPVSHSTQHLLPLFFQTRLYSCPSAFGHDWVEREEIPMSRQHTECWSRREFLGGLTLAGTAGLLGVHARRVAAEPPPETTRIRLVRIPSICQAPSYVAEELLRSEGFTEVHYLQKAGTADIETALASGEADLNGFQAATVRKPTVALGEMSFKELQATNRCRLNDFFERDDLSPHLTARHNFPENSVSRDGRQPE